MQIDTSRLPHQFKHWAIHCSLNSLPSFAIALIWLRLWERPAAVIAMIAAIFVFIVLYTLITSLQGPFSDPDHLLSRALRAGTRSRMWISILSLLMTFPPLMFFMPDFWCGMLAAGLMNFASRNLGGQPDAIGMNRGDFISVFGTTLLEGFILSFLLLMICFFALVVIQIRDRKKDRTMTAGGALPHITAENE